MIIHELRFQLKLIYHYTIGVSKSTVRYEKLTEGLSKNKNNTIQGNSKANRYWN